MLQIKYLPNTFYHVSIGQYFKLEFVFRFYVNF
jgi:hypothetical protein